MTTAPLSYSLVMNSRPSLAYDDDIPSDDPDRSPLHVLHSPTYSIYSDATTDCYHTCSESTSSLDHSAATQPAQDKFKLSELMFSSCDESSSDNELDNDISDIIPTHMNTTTTSNTNHTEATSLTDTRHRLNDVIIVSSEDEVPPTSSLPLSPCLVVNIPRNLVKFQPNKLARKPTIKLALSHFATSRKRMLSMDSTSSPSTVGSLETTPTATPPNTLSPSRTPISLKLKRSATSNQWQAVPITTNNDVINDATTSSELSEDHKMEINGIAASPAIDALHDTCISKKHYVQDNEAANLPPALVNKSDEPLPSQLTPKESHDMPLKSCNLSLKSCDLPLESCDLTQKSCDLSCDLHLSSLSCSSDNESLYSTSSSYLASSDWNSTDDMLLRKNTRKRSKPPTQPQSKFSFTSVFNSISPCPKLSVDKDGILNPIDTLSIKGLLTAPADHPIHSWKTGRRVTNTNSKTKKRLKNQYGSSH